MQKPKCFVVLLAILLEIRLKRGIILDGVPHGLQAKTRGFIYEPPIFSFKIPLCSQNSLLRALKLILGGEPPEFVVFSEVLVLFFCNLDIHNPFAVETAF